MDSESIPSLVNFSVKLGTAALPTPSQAELKMTAPLSFSVERFFMLSTTSGCGLTLGEHHSRSVYRLRCPQNPALNADCKLLVATCRCRRLIFQQKSAAAISSR
jgi:hypothetical protein